MIRTLVAVALVPLGVIAVSFGQGCGDDLSESTTAGQRVTLGTRVTSDDDLSKPFVNAQGWSIALDRVLVSTGPVYYFDGEPPDLARRSPAQPPSLLRRWLTIPPAYAHPGHYQAGNAMGQMLEPAAFDLVAGDAVLSNGEGVTGPYRSATVMFHSPAAGELAQALGDNVVVVEGTADKEGETRKFRASAATLDVTNANGNPAVEACEFTPADVGSDGTIVVHISPSVWFDQVDFSGVPASTGDYEDLPSGGSVHQAFTLLGVTRASAYTFSFEGS